MSNIDPEERKGNSLDQRDLEAEEFRSMTECDWTEPERMGAIIKDPTHPEYQAAVAYWYARLSDQQERWRSLEVEAAQLMRDVVRRSRASGPATMLRRPKAGRAPRPVARASRVARSEVADGGADGPPAPRLGPAAALVSDATALAVVGLTKRQFRDFLRERGIPSAKVGRRTLARLDAVLAAMGLAGDPAPAAETEEWSADALHAELGVSR